MKLSKTFKIQVFLSLLLIPLFIHAQKMDSNRQQWLNYMDKVARPVMKNLANDQLKANMPVKLSDSVDNPDQRNKVAYLEAYGRTLCGIAPWLNGEGGSPEEQALREKYREWALKGIANAVDSTKDDYLLWKGYQPLVDAAFVAQGLIRCPWLWNNLEPEVQQKVEEALRASQSIKPFYSNWILFPAMIEAFFCKYDMDYDPVRIEYGIREFANHWYVGDGMFTDGEEFALDYYNSYVIQPFLMDIMNAIKERDDSFEWFRPKLKEITERYAEIQERTINADGTYPVYGRSIVYRSGAFHHLANMALEQKLPSSLSPAQVRGALTAVLDQTLGAEGTFDENGWMKIGLHGHQPKLADFYITTGSLYLCSAVFLPLGLPDDAPFWIEPSEPWTAKEVWD